MSNKRILKIITKAILIVLLTPLLFITLHKLGRMFGFVRMPVTVIGTGSMYPSFFWEKSEGGPEDPETKNLYEFRTEPLMYHFVPYIEIFGKRINLRSVGRGDIVAFRNAETKNILKKENKDQRSGFIKRVIGISGDTIEIRDGFVILNGKTISEPYIYKPRSTYGDSFLQDCNAIKIPDGYVFVMGDNRKVSSDSRGELGLVSIQDISFILPYKEQSEYHSFWRDTSKDKDLANKPTLDSNEFYKKLNDIRKVNNKKPLKPSIKLEKSAYLRSKKILETNDFSTSATKSGFTMVQAMKVVGYNNPLTGEFISHGYYDADELIQSIKYSDNLKKQVLDSRYQDIGISVFNGEINNCPTQVIVGHLGGYIPAKYSKDTIDSWKKLRDNLNEVIPSWERARNYDRIDKQKLERLLTILYTRRDLANEIYSVMTKRQWLTEDQQQRIKQDEALATESKSLIDYLNSQ